MEAYKCLLWKKTKQRGTEIFGSGGHVNYGTGQLSYNGASQLMCGLTNLLCGAN